MPRKSRYQTRRQLCFGIYNSCQEFTRKKICVYIDMYTCLNSVVNGGRERFICESTTCAILLFFATLSNPFPPRLRRLWVMSAKILFNETNHGEIEFTEFTGEKFPRNETREREKGRKKRRKEGRKEERKEGMSVGFLSVARFNVAPLIFRRAPFSLDSIPKQ